MKLYDELLIAGHHIHNSSFKVPHSVWRLTDQKQSSHPSETDGKLGHRRTVSNPMRSPQRGPQKAQPEAPLLFLPVCHINPQLASEFDYPLSTRETSPPVYTKIHRIGRKEHKKIDLLSENVMAATTSQSKWLGLELTTNGEKDEKPRANATSHK